MNARLLPEHNVTWFFVNENAPSLVLPAALNSYRARWIVTFLR
jgi:hypothetical protein